MKKFLLGILCAVGVLNAGAANYAVDFNTAVDTSDPAFKVAPGWKHLVSTGSYSSQKVTYTYVADGGEDGSGCLQAGPQSYFDYWDYKDVPLYDLLVSPAVGGTVTLDVKKATPAGTVTFYKVTEAGGQLVRGAEIAWTGDELIELFYTTVTLSNVEPGTMIGIRSDNVLIDNFTASQVDLQLQKALTITSSTPNATGLVDCNSSNQFEVGGKVKFKNTGDLPIESGKETFSLAMMKQDAAGNFVVDKIVGTFPISEGIAVGEESGDIAFTATINESDVEEVDGSKARRYDIVSDICPQSKIFVNVTPVPYRPLPVYSTAKAASLEAGDEIDMGIVTGSGDLVITVTNNGAADMNIKTVATTGAGFSCSPAANLTVAKHDSEEITITLSSDVIGEKTGTVTITADGLDPVTFNLKGNILDPNAWFVDFEDGKIPGNMIAEEGWSTSNKLTIAPNLYYAVGEKTDSPSKLISPLLSVDNGATISFEGARCYDTSFIKVYTSSDRKNWTLVRTLSPEADNDADKLSSEYSGTAWGANTKYVFTTFTLANLPSEPFYLAFEAGNARIDNILGGKVVDVDHDVYVLNIDAPSVGMVNNAVAVTASVKNLLAAAETAGSFTIALMEGNEELATAESVDIEGFQYEDFHFSFTPHQEGEMTLRVVFTAGDYVAESDPFNINVTEELAVDTKQVGDLTDSGTSKTAPVNAYNYKSQSETVYTADLLGLKAGTKITRLVYKGESTRDVTMQLKVWMENTDDATPQSVLLNDGATDGMTAIYDGNYTFNKTSGKTDLLVIDLPEPFEYTGGNVRIVMSHTSSGFSTTTFETDKNVKTQSIIRASDSNLPNSFSASQLPVVYMTTSVDPDILKGTISDKNGKGVANAQVVITSGDVIYQASTDETGAYSMKVVQSSLDYSMTVSADGYKTFTADIQLENPETVKDVILEDDTTSAVENVNVINDGRYYDLNGRLLPARPERGLYIFNGKVYNAI